MPWATYRLTAVAHRRLIALLAAVALVAGCGGGSAKKTVTVELTGATGNQNFTACAKQAAFFLYNGPAQVRFNGTVKPAPDGRWKVKVKIKQCSAGKFVDVTSQKLVGQSSGRYDGAIPVAEKGYYYARAQLEGGAKPRSQKEYFRIG
jgi:hypothetical protein